MEPLSLSHHSDRLGPTSGIPTGKYVEHTINYLREWLATQISGYGTLNPMLLK